MPQPLPQRLRTLVRRLDSLGEASPASVAALLAEARIRPGDLEAWHDFDHEPADSYGRSLVHDGGFYELMVMSWDPGDMSMIHDHGHSQWGAVRLFGPAEHAIFKLEENRLTTRVRERMAGNEVLPVGPALIHQMGNMTDERFASLHLYGCFGRRGGITDNARQFHLDEGSVQRTGGGVFFELPEDQVLAREEGVEADFATRLRFRVENLNRLLRIAASVGGDEAPAWELAHLGRPLFDARFWAPLWTELDPDSGVDSGSDRGPVRRSAPGILEQELRAAARLQHRLLDGAWAGPLDGHPLHAFLGEHRLTRYGAGDGNDTSRFLEGYLTRLRGLGSVESDPVAHAAAEVETRSSVPGSILDAG